MNQLTEQYVLETLISLLTTEIQSCKALSDAFQEKTGHQYAPSRVGILLQKAMARYPCIEQAVFKRPKQTGPQKLAVGWRKKKD